MKIRPSVLILLCLAALFAAWLLWPRGGQPSAPTAATTSASGAVAVTTSPGAPAVADTNSVVAENLGKLSAAATNRLALRLANTDKTIDELSRAPHAVLLENAFVDTERAVNFSIPKNLSADGDPGAWIVSAQGRVDAAFHAMLAAAGATEISYIPNNAWLVRMPAGAVASLKSSPLVQAVLPYEPYYKVQSSLLAKAVAGKSLPIGQALTLGLFADGSEVTLAEISKLGGVILSRDRSPFGLVVRVNPPADWIALARLPGVMRMEPAVRRKLANDLTRVILGVAANSVTTNTYLNLSGSNVTVEVNDSGIDASHPDLMTFGNVAPSRVTGLFPSSTNDIDGHGTHVAGIIAGNGFESSTVTNARGSIMPGTNTQFRGKAPLAKLVALGFIGANDTNVFVGDSELQEAPANTNALISNNSWVNGDANEYDLSAASWDASVRDALPELTGPQPILPVFSAGNDGGGADNGQNGNADSILSPATAKNVVTVGALEQFRNITNEVILLGTTNPTAIWTAGSDSSSQVASYSARGNVGILTEGNYGRFKPDVVAPGSWVVSLRSSMWDTNAYYNVTNDHAQFYNGLVVTSNSLNYGILTIPQNAIAVRITITGNGTHTLPIYVAATGIPTATTYDFTRNNVVSIPPDAGGTIAGLNSILNSQIQFAIGIGTNTQSVTYNLKTEVVTTNDLGNTLAVLQGLNDNLGTRPWYYRYETGTSMAAPAVSGTLALMQDFFTNTLHLTPSPALLKAMLINGARVSGSYKFAVTNSINYQGWGVPKLTNSIPAVLTNSALGANRPLFFLDQSPTNTLATGDRRTFNVNVPTAAARAQWLRVTLAWTDPPGNPAAAIKLVNDLDLVVTNVATGQVYYGNNFNAGSPPASLPALTNALPDNINNVENVYLTPTLGSNYTITVVGHAVNVNAVTLEQTNVVQDFTLVVTSGEGNNTNGVTFTPAAPSLSGNLAPPVTYWAATNDVILNQYAGANAPWLSTNSVFIGTNFGFGSKSTLFTGQSNQWHFFVITNTLAISNADFKYVGLAAFLPNTAAIPREGGYVATAQNPTRPEADIEMYVASSLTEPLVAQPLDMMNLSVLSNCVRRLNGDAASIGRGGNEFVTFSNSVANQVYYVAVKCEDQMAGQFAFSAIISTNVFSRRNPDGSIELFFNQLPRVIPDGNNAHAGFITALAFPGGDEAANPITIRRVMVTNVISHQNFGDLVGGLTYNSTVSSVLNNHDGFGVGTFTNVYDDSGEVGTNVARHTDAPGTLRNFAGKSSTAIWQLTELDNNLTQTGRVERASLRLYPHRSLEGTPGGTLTENFCVTVEAGSWFYDFIDVPVGYTNLLLTATNGLPASVPPIQMFLNGSTPPDLNNFLAMTQLTNGTPPVGVISYGPPLAPGRYWFALFNPDTESHDVCGSVVLSYNAAAISTVDYVSSGPLALRDDAVTTDSILVTNNQAIQSFSVGLRVDHPRISDLVFHLVSPSGVRYLLMENRGNQDTNGCGATVITTNIINVNANGGATASTNRINTGVISGTFPITYDFYYAPDEMSVYYGTNPIPANLIYDTGFTNNGVRPGPTTPRTISLSFAPTNSVTSTYLTIVMNQFGNSSRLTQWTYTFGGVLTNQYYLTFAETNFPVIADLAPMPIKFLPPPFVPVTNTLVVWTDSFEAYPLGTNFAPTPLGTWSPLNGQSVIATNPPANDFINWLALPAGGVLSNTLPTVPSVKYQLSYALGALPYEEFYVANAGSSFDGTLQQIDTNGIVTPFGGAQLQPDAVAVDGSGNVYVADSGDGSIERYTPNGARTIFVPSGSGLIYPDGLAFDSAGNLYVADSFDFGPTSGFVMRFNPAGVGTLIVSNLNNPVGLAIDAGNNLYVAELGNSDVLKITPSGVVSPFATNSVATNNLSGPYGLAMDSFTNLYIADNFNGNICVIGPLGGTPGVLTNMLFATGGLPYALAFDSRSNLYISDTLSVISKIPPAGALTNFAIAGINPQGLAYFNNNPEGRSTLGWSSQATVFTAQQAGTPLVLDANFGTNIPSGPAPSPIIPNGFNFNTTFDTFVLQEVPSDMYCQPEQSIDDLLGTGASGEWQLEVMDNRAGATNNTTLVSWRMEFILANTNLAPASFGPLVGGVASHNTLVAGGGYYGYYTVPVPPAASYATNLLLTSTLPVNVWSTTNFPPTVGGPNDALLISSATAGSATLVTATLPPVYYLVIENTNSAPVTFDVKVNFDVAGMYSKLQFTSATRNAAGKPQLSWRANRGARYRVQWSDVLPPVWHTITTPQVTTTNGVSTFTDNGTQTGPLGAKRFYRLVRIP